MSNELITVIVPVYNVEKYLDKCLESIIYQTYNNLEIIIVDNGSTDKSYEVCKEYAKRDKRIVLINEKTKGVSRARNIALDRATGDYITFIDSDDYVSEKYIEQLYIQCKNSNADISIIGTIDFDDESGQEVHKSSGYTNILNTEGAIQELLNEKYFSGVIWGKLYNKKLWNKIRFNIDTRIAEDVEVLYYILKKCKYISIDTNKLSYYYRIRGTSALKQNYNKDFENEINIVDRIGLEVKKEYPRIYNYAIKRYVRINLTCILKYYKENREFEGVEHLINNIKKLKMRKYAKASIKQRIRIIVVLYFKGILICKYK